MAIEGVLQTGVNAYAFHVHDHPVLQLSLVLSWRPEAMEGFTSNICLGKFSCDYVMSDLFGCCRDLCS